MTTRDTWHPVLRHAAVLWCVALAAGTLPLAYGVAPSSVGWLVAFYAALGMLLLARRQEHRGPAHGSFQLYLFFVIVYLGLVWAMFTIRPGPDPAATAESVVLAIRLLGFGGIFVAPALLRFAIRFTQTEHPAWRWIERMAWAGGCVFLVLQLAGSMCPQAIYRNGKWMPAMKGFYPHFFGYISSVLTAAFFLLVYTLFTVRPRQRRWQVFYFTAGAVPMWSSCWLHFLISMGIRLPTLGGSFYVAHVLILGYAVLVHQVYDFGIVIRRGLAYGAVCMLLGAAYGLLLFATSRFLHPDGVLANLLPAVGFVTVAGLLYAPLLSALQRRIDRYFFRVRADREALLAIHSRRMASAMRLDEVLHELAAVLRDGLNARRVWVFLPRANGTWTLQSAHGESPAPDFQDGEREAWAAWLAAHPPGEVQALPEPQSRPDAPARGVAWSESGAFLLVPVRHQEETLAVALVPPQRADELYDSEDLRFARTVADNTSVALRNARQYAHIASLEQLTRLTLDGLSTGVAVLHRDGGVVLINPAALALAGATEGPPPGRLEEWLRACPVLAEAVAGGLRDGIRRETVPLQWTQPERRFALWSMRGLDGFEDDALFLVLLQDLTAYKDLEVHLQRQENLARLGQFVSAINHELANLMQPIRHQAGKLEQLNLDHPEFQHAARLIPERLDAMDRMLEALRNYARPLTLRKRPVAARSLLLEIARDFEARGAELSVEVAPEAERCSCDPAWLEQVVRNLLQNAFDATTRRTGARVTLRATREAGAWMLRVADNGPGIPAAQRAFLFEPFHSTKDGKGTGLGLALCRKIATLHGGSIDAADAAEGGAEFVLRLPQPNASQLQSVIP
ncbi:MAG: hypothetical protein AMXMBFR7_30350 [Planctomycetota bacterium]